jgi:hemolysin III
MTVPLHAHDEKETVPELWNALTHGAGAVISLGAGAVLVTLVAVRGDGWQLAGAIVFCLSMLALYVASTLYHAIPQPVAKRRLKVLDHCAIFVLIAGTYTPFALVALRDSVGWWLFAAAWSLALLGIVFKLFFTGRFKFASTAVYVGMGWMVVFTARPFLHAVPMPIVGWLLAGGVAYTLGTVFYLAKHRHAHAVWHGFVLLGSTCHFVAVALLLLARGMPAS